MRKDRGTSKSWFRKVLGMSNRLPDTRIGKTVSGRLQDLLRFYSLHEQLERRLGGRRPLGACHGRMDWPQRGVYFFMEDGERRTETGLGGRIRRPSTGPICLG